MTSEHRERRISDALEDFHRRLALGEDPAPGEYRARLGGDYDDFLAVLEASTAIDEALAPPFEPELPRVFGGYILEKRLGRGAMGVVYQAFHRELARRVALKILRTSFDTEPKALERFRREARQCAQVRHPNVVQVYEAGEEEGRPYYAMELLEGESLEALVKRRAAPPPDRLFAAMAGVADALDALHRAGIVHRDVKPSNVVVQPDGRMVLADFGLARSVAAVSLTGTGEAIGTPLYMSPEQMLGRRGEVDARSDVYGLGATLYEALTGRPPFATKDMPALVRMILFQRPTPVRQLAPAVPAAAEAVVMKALEKRREDRYATAGDLRDDLRAFAMGRTTVGRPVSPVRRFVRAARPWAPAVAALLVLVVGLGLWWSRRPATLFIAPEYPAVSVLLDGRDIGVAGPGEPLSYGGVSPGDHLLTLRAPGFEERSDRIAFSSGGTLRIGERFPLRLASPPDPLLQTEMLRRLGWPLGPGKGANARQDDPFSAPQVFRRVADGGEWAEWPRGPVRLADLVDVRLRIVPSSSPFPSTETGLELHFLRPDLSEDLVPPLAVPPSALDWTAPFPADLRERLRPGDQVAWGVFPRGWKPHPSSRPWKRDGAPVSTFQVVDPGDVDAVLADLDGRLGGRDASLRAVAHARVLVARGLATAAARALLPLSPAERGLAGSVVLYAAMRVLRLDVADSPTAMEALGEIQAYEGTPAYDRAFDLHESGGSPR